MVFIYLSSQVKVHLHYISSTLEENIDTDGWRTPLVMCDHDVDYVSVIRTNREQQETYVMTYIMNTFKGYYRIQHTLTQSI